MDLDPADRAPLGLREGDAEKRLPGRAGRRGPWLGQDAGQQEQSPEWFVLPRTTTQDYCDAATIQDHDTSTRTSSMRRPAASSAPSTAWWAPSRSPRDWVAIRRSPSARNGGLT